MNEQYSAEELAEEYQISPQQAVRYIARFGARRDELDSFLASCPRTAVHRQDEINRSPTIVAFG